MKYDFTVAHIAWDGDGVMGLFNGDELIFLIEGENADESGPVPTGNLSYRPNGCTHTVTTTNGATALNFVWGSAEMLE